jgi:hypothetical protein
MFIGEAAKTGTHPIIWKLSSESSTAVAVIHRKGTPLILCGIAQYDRKSHLRGYCVSGTENKSSLMFEE